jgi:hypothetical protein
LLFFDLDHFLQEALKGFAPFDAAFALYLLKPLHDDLKELFEISGLWVRNVGSRHDTKRQIQQLVRRIIHSLPLDGHARTVSVIATTLTGFAADRAAVSQQSITMYSHAALQNSLFGQIY